MVSKELGMQVATFRFGVIADFVTGTKLDYGEKDRLIDEKAARTYVIPGSERSRISRSTIMSWIAAYKVAGFRLEGLIPKQRKDLGVYKKLDATLRMAVRQLKTENPHYTVPVIITKLKHDKLLQADEKINKSSLYRFIEREGLDQAVPEEQKDKRKFEAAFPNELWQCDVMHGPLVKITDGPQKKAYLIAIMDDHSRLVIHAQFYLDETADSLKDCLRQAIEMRGLPSKFYVDNGACYRALHLEQILALLGIALIHSKAYQPQGRGKIERWFRYVRQDFIPVYADRPLSLDQLNERLASWVDTYNASVHGVTKMSPYERFKKNIACIRPSPPALIEYFRQVEHRRVRKDRTIQLNGQFFEVAVKLIDKKVELRFHQHTPNEVEVFFEGLSYGRAVKVDVHVNARIGRQSDEVKDLGPHHLVESGSIQSGRLFGGANASVNANSGGIES